MTERQVISIMAAILCQATIADNDCDENTRVAVERAVELYGLVEDRTHDDE